MQCYLAYIFAVEQVYLIWWLHSAKYYEVMCKMTLAIIAFNYSASIYMWSDSPSCMHTNCGCDGEENKTFEFTFYLRIKQQLNIFECCVYHFGVQSSYYRWVILFDSLKRLKNSSTQKLQLITANTKGNFNLGPENQKQPVLLCWCIITCHRLSFVPFSLSQLS